MGENSLDERGGVAENASRLFASLMVQWNHGRSLIRLKISRLNQTQRRLQHQARLRVDDALKGIELMVCRSMITISGVLVLLIGCSGGESPQEDPTTAPPTRSMAQQAYVKASNTDADDGFGGRIALDGDTLVVGASSEDTSVPNSGAVYVFIRSNRGWTQQAYLKASNAVAGDGFGGSVALAGNTLAIGAPFKDSGAGAVYVFTRRNGVWTEEASLKASNTEAPDNFGGGVALVGDTLVVGAPFEDSNATGINDNDKQSNNEAVDSGAVYIFTRSSGAWTQQAYVKASNTGAFDGFGGPLAFAGNTLVVGASGQDTDGTNSGAVYVFTRSVANGVTTWSQQAFLKATNVKAGEQFGASVTLSGDTLAVGAPAPPNPGNSAGGSGTVYVFTRNGTTWAQQAEVKASNAAVLDEFGRSVALDGEMLVVGAPGEDSSAVGINDNGKQGDNNAPNSGAAYVFRRTNGVWTQQAYVKASNTESGDNFGGRVAVDGSTLAIGAAGEDSSATGMNGPETNNDAPQSGAVYVMQ